MQGPVPLDLLKAVIKITILKDFCLTCLSLLAISTQSNICWQSWGREYYRGTYHCTIDLLFDWFGISCMTTDNFCHYLQNRLIQKSQTGGQWYTDTSPFRIPWLGLCRKYIWHWILMIAKFKTLSFSNRFKIRVCVLKLFKAIINNALLQASF
jgi:hypothetical protein